MMAGKIEAIIMTVLFAVIAGCFSIPIFIFVTDSQDATPKRNIIEHLDISDCTWQAMQVRSYMRNITILHGYIRAAIWL